MSRNVGEIAPPLSSVSAREKMEHLLQEEEKEKEREEEGKQGRGNVCVCVCVWVGRM